MRKWCIFSVLFFASAGSWAQNQLNHEKKFFVSTDGKVYCNKSKPIYVRISDSPDENAKSYLLKSEKTPQYSNPMYLDSEGWNSFRSPSAVDTTTKQMIFPEQDIIFDIYGDSKAPSSSVVYDPKLVILKKGKILSKGSLSLTFKAYDELSGVEGIYVSLDGGNYQKQTTAIVLDKEKTFTIKYYSVDNVGNVEAPKTETFVIDMENPVSEAEIMGDNFENIISARSYIKLKSKDSISGLSRIMYKLDEQKERVYAGPIYASALSQGEHKIVYYSVDQVNNKESERTLDFYVDKTPPTILQEIVGKTFIANGKEFSSGSSKLKITTFDNKAGVKEIYYSLDGKEFKLYDQPVTLSSYNGVLNIQAYAIDKVNNKSQGNESAQRSNSVSAMDLDGPLLKHSFVGPVFSIQDSIYINNKTKIKLMASDQGSGANKLEYSINKGELINYTAPFVLEKEGTHIINYTGYDNVDNTSYSEFNVVTDNTGPEIFYTFSTNPIKPSIYPNHVVLFLSATDLLSGYDNMVYQVNANPFKAYLGQIREFSKPGVYKVAVKATDKLGNESIRQVEFTIQ